MRISAADAPELLEQVIVKEEQIDENVLGQTRNYASLISFIFLMQVLPKRFGLACWKGRVDEL